MKRYWQRIAVVWLCSVFTVQAGNAIQFRAMKVMPENVPLSSREYAFGLSHLNTLWQGLKLRTNLTYSRYSYSVRRPAVRLRDLGITLGVTYAIPLGSSVELQPFFGLGGSLWSGMGEYMVESYDYWMSSDYSYEPTYEKEVYFFRTPRRLLEFGGTGAVRVNDRAAVLLHFGVRLASPLSGMDQLSIVQQYRKVYLFGLGVSIRAKATE